MAHLRTARRARRTALLLSPVMMVMLALVHTCLQHADGDAPAEALDPAPVYTQQTGGGLRGAVRRLLEKDHLQPVKSDDPDFYTDVALSIGLVCTSGLMAGLTIGMLSVEPLELEIYLNDGGTPEQKMYAERIWPVINSGHRLLVTLLLVNTAASEALPLFLDRLVNWKVALALSVTLVLMFGEIIPSATFAGKRKLQLSSMMVPLVRTLQFVLYPLVWPLGKLLDCLLGDAHTTSRFNRNELRTMVRLHQVREFKKEQRENRSSGNSESGSDHGGDDSGDHKSSSAAGGLLFDEVTIIQHALSMGTRQVSEVMTKFDDIKSLSSDSRLNANVIALLVGFGYSRIPVYEKNPWNVRAVLIMKKLIAVDHSLAPTISSLPMRQPLAVSPDTNLIDMLNEFQVGRSHIALVVRDPEDVAKRWSNGKPLLQDQVLGLITCEDVLEELIGEEIEDEEDYDRRNPLLGSILPLQQPLKSATFSRPGSNAEEAADEMDAKDATLFNLKHPMIQGMLLQNAANKLIREVENDQGIDMEVTAEDILPPSVLYPLISEAQQTDASASGVGSQPPSRRPTPRDSEMLPLLSSEETANSESGYGSSDPKKAEYL